VWVEEFVSTKHVLLGENQGVGSRDKKDKALLKPLTCKQSHHWMMDIKELI
jgi:hypothetical protein